VRRGISSLIASNYPRSGQSGNANFKGGALTIDDKDCSPEDKRSLVTILADIRKDAAAQRKDVAWIRDQVTLHESRLNDTEKQFREFREILMRQEESRTAAVEDIKDTKEILQKYLPMWKAISDNQKSRQTLHQAIMEKSIVGVVWGAILLGGMSVWHYIKYLISLPNG